MGNELGLGLVLSLRDMILSVAHLSVQELFLNKVTQYIEKVYNDWHWVMWQTTQAGLQLGNKQR